MWRTTIFLLSLWSLSTSADSISSILSSDLSHVLPRKPSWTQYGISDRNRFGSPTINPSYYTPSASTSARPATRSKPVKYNFPSIQASGQKISTVLETPTNEKIVISATIAVSSLYISSKIISNHHVISSSYHISTIDSSNTLSLSAKPTTNLTITSTLSTRLKTSSSQPRNINSLILGLLANSSD